MKHLLSFSLSLALVAAPAIAQPANIPQSQQRSPAGLETYPYRPACKQLTAAPGGSADWLAWGPLVNGEHQTWHGLKTATATTEIYQHLATAGLCVEGGVVVPLSITDGSIAATAPAEATKRSPMEENIERLRNAPQNREDGDSSGGATAFFILFGVTYLGYTRYVDQQEKKRLEESDRAQPAPCPRTESFGSTNIPDRVSPEDLVSVQLGQQPHPAAPAKKRTALEVLCASPFVSRAFYGFQRSGKTNLVANAANRLKQTRGIETFVLNLSSFGTEDAAYWQDFRGVFGDLLAASPEAAETLIKQAIALVDEFMAHPTPAILVCDEWTFMGAKHGEHADILAPLVKGLASKITGFASSGMKRRKALWAISPTIVAGELEDFAKSIKKLSPCVVAIAPSHAEHWEGDELTFSRELFNQVLTNYPGALSEPPATSEVSRIACINGEWLALGTQVLVTAAAPNRGGEVVDTFPKPLESSPELELLQTWLSKKVGEVIDYAAFKNANCFREISRSKEGYLMLCDKAVIKGWLSQRGEETFFVLD